MYGTGQPAQSGELEDLLRQYSAAGTRAEQMALLEDMLYAWANTSGFYKSLEERCAADAWFEQGVKVA